MILPRLRPQKKSSDFTPADAINDTDIQKITEKKSVLDESDIIYMILTDRFYDSDSSNNGTLGVEYRPGELKYTQGGDWNGITQKLDTSRIWGHCHLDFPTVRK